MQLNDRERDITIAPGDNLREIRFSLNKNNGFPEMVFILEKKDGQVYTQTFESLVEDTFYQTYPARYVGQEVVSVEISGNTVVISFASGIWYVHWLDLLKGDSAAYEF